VRISSGLSAFAVFICTNLAPLALNS
jgi:hypothetical protein